MNATHLLATAALAAALAATPMRAQDADRDGLPDVIEQKIGTHVNRAEALVRVAKSARQSWSDEEAKRHAPDIVRFDACHVGGKRVLFKITFARKPDFAGATFIIYADLDNDPNTGRVDKYHRGVDAMLTIRGDSVGITYTNPDYNRRNTQAAAAIHGNALYVSLDAPLNVVGKNVVMGLHLLSQRPGGRGDGTSHKVVKLPFMADVKAPKIAKRTLSLRSLADYRWYNDKVKLEKLSDKGLTYEQIAPKTPIKFGRPRPPIPFSAARKPGKAGAIRRLRVKVNLLEEAGVARSATPITFGLPLPKGGLYDLANMRVLAPDGGEVPAQFTATAFWPYDSLKWVLIDFQTKLAAKENADYAVEFGSEVARAKPATQLRVNETDDAITVRTGPLEVVIDKQRFNIFRRVRLNGKDVAASAEAGVLLVDEHGKRFAASARKPNSVKIEEQGPQKVVVRVAGDYADAQGKRYMSYVTRLTFRNGSPRVAVAHTHVNTYVKTEFTDITSLSMGLRVPGAAPRFKVEQFDEKPRSNAGAVSVVGPAGPVGLAVHEFRERWPKALRGERGRVAIDILPQQPSKDYGKDLPHWLQYCFVDGKYRFKWGMSFTTRITFDFSGTAPAKELLADADTPVVAVLPGAWYAGTQALGEMAAPLGKQFAQWDKYVARAYEQHMVRKRQYREYGFFNYGDWYGERGRNWGNNEYDLAHGFFMQFARTGRRDYFRLALAAARHQADVDCVHAYPDPFYVGANHQHSIGHTGTWSQRPLRATWSHRYDSHTDARNGHTWASGMMDAWYLTGDARVMNASIGLGEHIAWAMSRDFKRLGTHERSAGWSLHAIMAIYRGTYDPVYLAAAKRIVEVPLREQKFDDGGAWPHLLPGDHSGGRRGARGNNLFLVGILLAGLTDYHEETGDPRVEKALISGARWVMKSWDPDAEGWPYSAGVNGEPFYDKATNRLNMLITDGLAYAAQLTNYQAMMQCVETAFASLAYSGAPSIGKSIAQKLHFSADIMGRLQQWWAGRREDKGIHMVDDSAAGIARMIAKTRDAKKHRVRAPDEKVFFVKAGAAPAELIASRSPHGAMTKRAAFGTIQVSDAAGRVVAEGKFSTDGPHEFRATLKRRGVYKVLVRDDQRGVWSLSGKGLQIVAQTVKGFRIGGVGRARFHFFVPKGTAEFRIKLLGVHRGPYGAAVIAPGGKIVAMHESENIGLTYIKGAPQMPGAEKRKMSATGVIAVKPEPDQTGQMWSLALWAHMDIGVELEGVPPYLALSRGAWFQPK